MDSLELEIALLKNIYCMKLNIVPFPASWHSGYAEKGVVLSLLQATSQSHIAMWVLNSHFTQQRIHDWGSQQT